MERHGKSWQKTLSAGLLLGVLIVAGMLTPAQAATPLEEESTEGITSRFMLMNQYGETVTNNDFGDHYLLIYFGYTFCPDICPTSLTTITQALKLLGDQAERIQPLFITVDPARDTPEVLRHYVAYFDPRLLGLTGTPELIKRTADNFHVRYEKIVEPGQPADQYQMNHSAGVFLIAPNGTFLVKFAHGISAQQMAKRLRDFL